MIGDDPATVRLPRAGKGQGPRREAREPRDAREPREAREAREALETSIEIALGRPPCVVSFSGGRDSSAVLALAANVARRRGLALPLPATLVFPGLPETDETSWQESVIRHLDLPDWERIELTDELDIVGPRAAELLRSGGVRWPPTAAQLTPLIGVAAGGTLLTGLGGDEVFGTPGSHLMKALAGRARPRPRDLLHAGLVLAPRRVRARRVRRRDGLVQPWLTATGQAMVGRALADWEAGLPDRWGAGLGSWWRSRALQSMLSMADAQGRAADVAVGHPFVGPVFLVAMQRLGGIGGFPGRTSVTRELFGDLIPEAVISRTSKAVFDRAVRSDPSRHFATTWDGGGLEHLPVRPEVLREMWLSPEPCFPTFLLLQTAWLATEGSADHRQHPLA